MGKWFNRASEYQDNLEGPPLPSFFVTMIGDLESRLERLEGTAKGDGESDLSRLLDVNRPQPKVELTHGPISVGQVKRETVGWVLRLGTPEHAQYVTKAWGLSCGPSDACIYDSPEAAKAWRTANGTPKMRVVRLVRRVRA